MDKNNNKNDIIKKQNQEVKQEDEDKKIESQNVNINEENNDGTKDIKCSKKQNKIYVAIICFFVLIGIMYFTTKRYDYLVYPNITLYKENVSKLNEKQLNAKINILVDNINNNSILIKIDNKEYEVFVSDIIGELNVEKIKDEIIGYGKDRTFLEQFGLIYLGVKRNYNFDIKINNDALQKQVNKIYDDTYVAAIEPTFEVNGDNLNIIKGRNGKNIDEKNLINEIIGKINSNEVGRNNIIFEEEYKTIKPQINYKDLKGVDYKISSATTYFGGSGYNRALNIDNAVSKIDGTLLMPGDEFSYEKKVSPVELSNGYYMAPVIVNGSHKDAPGGGVCQVSTTLYNAELKAGILPKERHNHSKSVSYVQRGLDATLATGSKNLRFKNTYDYPIYIHAYTVGGQITVEFWSNESVLGGKKYVPTSFIKGNVANTYLYGYNNKGELIYKQFIDTSIYG